MSRNIPETLRVKVARRANLRCEYCLLPEAYAMYPFEIDHILGQATVQLLAFNTPERIIGRMLLTEAGEYP